MELVLLPTDVFAYVTYYMMFRCYFMLYAIYLRRFLCFAAPAEMPFRLYAAIHIYDAAATMP